MPQVESIGDQARKIQIRELPDYEDAGHGEPLLQTTDIRQPV